MIEAENSTIDIFTLVGSEKQGEQARLDYIEFIPTLSV